MFAPSQQLWRRWRAVHILRHRRGGDQTVRDLRVAVPELPFQGVGERRAHGLGAGAARPPRAPGRRRPPARGCPCRYLCIRPFRSLDRPVGRASESLTSALRSPGSPDRERSGRPRGAGTGCWTPRRPGEGGVGPAAAVRPRPPTCGTPSSPWSLRRAFYTLRTRRASMKLSDPCSLLVSGSTPGPFRGRGRGPLCFPLCFPHGRVPSGLLSLSFNSLYY